MTNDAYTQAIDRKVATILSGCSVADLVRAGDQLTQLRYQLEDLIKDRFSAGKRNSGKK